MKTWHPSENKMATTGKDKLPDQNSQINPYENRKPDQIPEKNLPDMKSK